MSFFDDAISTIGRGLAQTAIQEATDATGFDIGGTLNFLFNPDAGGASLTNLSETLGDKTKIFPVSPVELTYLKESVTQQQQQIAIVSEQLTAVQATVDAIKMETDEIEQLLLKIQQQGLFQSWQTADIPTRDHISAIQTCYQMYSMYISEYPGTPDNPGPTQTEITNLINQILDPNDGPLEASNFIHNLIIDQGMQQGLLQLWSNMVSQLVNGGQMDYRDAAAQYIDYYKSLTFAQLTATNLVIEAFVYNGDPTSPNKIYEAYKAAILAQENTFIQWLMPIINAGVTGSRVNVGGFTYFELAGSLACMELNPNYTKLQQGANYYSPSSILKEAEALLQALYCTDDEDRRIVVHMNFFAYESFSSILKPVVLTLAGSTSTPIAPTSSTVIGPYAVDTAPGDDFSDQNWCGIGFNYYLKRFVYSTNRASNLNPTLPDDNYLLTDLNGQDNLIGMQTYTTRGGTTPFLLNSVLSYGLTVNEQSSFDFMNFLAYNCPYNA